MGQLWWYWVCSIYNDLWIRNKVTSERYGNTLSFTLLCYKVQVMTYLKLAYVGLELYVIKVIGLKLLGCNLSYYSLHKGFLRVSNLVTRCVQWGYVWKRDQHWLVVCKYFPMLYNNGVNFAVQNKGGCELEKYELYGWRQGALIAVSDDPARKGLMDQCSLYMYVLLYRSVFASMWRWKFSVVILTSTYIF